MELSAEVVVEEGDVELSLGLSLGGHCNRAVVPLKAIFNQRSGEEAEDPSPVLQGNVSPVAEKERESVGMLDRGRRTREKAHRHEENELAGKKRQQWQQRQEDDENKRHKVLKETETERINGEIASPRFNPSSNPNPNPNPTPNHSDDLKTQTACNARPPSPPNTANSDLAQPPHEAFPMVPMQYPYPPPQCLPFGFPYMVPWWSFPASSGSAVSATQGTNVFQPVPSRSFIPFHASGRKETNGATNRLPSLTTSQGSSFSAISDLHSGSHQGGSSSCSSDTRSNINHAVEEKSQANSSTKRSEPQQHSFSKLSPDQVQTMDNADVESTDNELVPNSTKSIDGPATQITKARPDSNNRVKHERTCATPGKNKALAGDQANPIVPALPEMPCVTTTGNGPNGKKITGFLYRYNKNEVSIVCVCHGSSFSPAEFIKHAGGTEVSHPLRHIIIVPSS